MTTIRLRRGSTAQWASANPVLAVGEPGYNSDTGALRIGNGIDVWSDLPDVGGGGGGAPTTAEYLTGATDGGLSAERVVTDTDSITWDLTTPGQAKAEVVLGTGATEAAAGDHNHTGVYEPSGTVATHAAVATTHGISAFGATLVDDADAAAARGTLGLGSMATVTPGGTPDGSKYLRDDNTWQSVTGGSGLTSPQVLARGCGC